MILENKVAIVTGAASGIGKAITLRFAAEGAKLVPADVDEENARQVAQEIERMGREAQVIRTDVSDQESVEGMVQAAKEAKLCAAYPSPPEK